jgi:hypothetical protein
LFEEEKKKASRHPVKEMDPMVIRKEEKKK